MVHLHKLRSRLLGVAQDLKARAKAHYLAWMDIALENTGHQDYHMQLHSPVSRDLRLVSHLLRPSDRPSTTWSDMFWE